MAEGWRAWLNVWEGFGVEAEEYRELDHKRVLVLTRFSGRGKTSAVEVGRLWTKAASLLYFHDGKVTKLVVYTDYERALADLGMS